jgi:hypothetical protein
VRLSRDVILRYKILKRRHMMLRGSESTSNAGVASGGGEEVTWLRDRLGAPAQPVLQRVS